MKTVYKFLLAGKLAFNYWLIRCVKLALFMGGMLLALQTQGVNFTLLPPQLTEIKGSPMIMLNMSRDHQLFYKAYNEYPDLDVDCVTVTQYKHSYKYYGYFDNQHSYNYNTTDNRYVLIGKVTPQVTALTSRPITTGTAIA